MKQTKILQSVLIGVVIVASALTVGTVLKNQKSSPIIDSKIPYKIAENGLELAVSFDKPNYASGDTIVLKAEAKNTKRSAYLYETSSSCDTGFHFNLSQEALNNYRIESQTVDGKKIGGMMCAQVMGEGRMEPNQIKTLQLVLKPKEAFVAKNELRVEVSFDDQDLKFKLPVKIN